MRTSRILGDFSVSSPEFDDFQKIGAECVKMSLDPSQYFPPYPDVESDGCSNFQITELISDHRDTKTAVSLPILAKYPKTVFLI
jgi:hypothetical protein